MVDLSMLVCTDFKSNMQIISELKVALKEEKLIQCISLGNQDNLSWKG